MLSADWPCSSVVHIARNSSFFSVSCFFVSSSRRSRSWMRFWLSGSSTTDSLATRAPTPVSCSGLIGLAEYVATALSSSWSTERLRLFITDSRYRRASVGRWSIWSCSAALRRRRSVISVIRSLLSLQNWLYSLSSSTFSKLSRPTNWMLCSSSAFCMFLFSNVSFLIRRWYSNSLFDFSSMSFSRCAGIVCCGVISTTFGSASGVWYTMARTRASYT